MAERRTLRLPKRYALEHLLWGMHVGRSGSSGRSITQRIEDSMSQHGFNAAQIFVAGPRDSHIHMTTRDEREMSSFVDETSTTVIAHGAYVDVPWNGSHPAQQSIAREMQVCARAGIMGLVVHLPCADPSRVPDIAAKLVDPEQCILYLETPSCKPANSHYHLPALLSRLRKSLPLGSGFCIDTAHLWSNGINLADTTVMSQWLEGLDVIRGDDTPIAFHLNDNVHDLGSGRDKHAPIGSGQIWAKDTESLDVLLQYAAWREIPVLLERSETSVEQDVTIINKLMGASDARA